VSGEESGGGRYSIRSVHRVCDILDHLQRNPDGVTLADMAEVLELPKSSVFRYLVTLEDRDYAVRDAEGLRFFPGPAFLQSDSRRLDLLVQRAHPHLVALRDEVGETVNLGVLDGSEVVYLDVVESERSVRLAARVGARDPIHSTALGKALTATREEHVVQRLLDATDMSSRTDRTIVDQRGYLRELERVRRQGYALDDGENENDGRCVAVALDGAGEGFAISVSAPAARFPRRMVEAMAERLRATAVAIERDATDLR
jgi:IclR family acetate operon transcriptional repressor